MFVHLNGTVAHSNDTFSNNHAEAGGGALATAGIAKVHMAGLTFSSNRAPLGGDCAKSAGVT